MRAPRPGAYRGPAILAHGFRPFFLAGSVYAALAGLAWLPFLSGRLRIPTALAPLDWHVHEMLYGYVAAIIAGFLFTIIPNWTGRLPLQGGALACLVALWMAGRVAVTCSARLGPVAAGAIDALFLPSVLAVMAREVVAGRNWRNLLPLGALAVLTAGNLAFHLAVWRQTSTALGQRIGMAAAIGLVALVGGRVIPSFTRNWLARHRPGPLPAPFGRVDAAALGMSVAALAWWVVLPAATATAAAMLAASLLHLLRLTRWAGHRTLREGLVAALHAGYAFVAAGFVLLAGAGLYPQAISAGAGIHAWTMGAIGTLTLAIMARASLSYTGRQPVADAATRAILGAVLAAALARVGAAFGAAPGALLLQLAAASWAAAFLGFALRYGPLLARPRAGTRREPALPG